MRSVPPGCAGAGGQLGIAEALGRAIGARLFVMGWRTIRVGVTPDELPEVMRYFEQVCSWAKSRDISACIDESDCVIDVELSGNSSHLNDMSPALSLAAREIAADFDPNSRLHSELAHIVAMELAEQVVDWSDTQEIVVAREGRELRIRADGLAGAHHLIAEIGLHVRRLRRQLRAHRGASGPNAWRRRDQTYFTLSVDARTLISALRRVERLIADLATRIPGEHSDAVMGRFAEHKHGLIAIRNVIEHLDEYEVGKGRHDPEPEPAIPLDIEIQNDEVVITTRSGTASVGALAAATAAQMALRCSAAALKHQWMTTAPIPIADFDFVDADSGRIIRREDETAGQRASRAMVENLRPSLAPVESRCPECGLSL